MLKEMTLSSENIVSTLKISVVVTTYNHELYIHECLESIFTQSRPPDEVIICVDCGNDRTALIVEPYKNKTGVSVLIACRRLGPLFNTLRGVKFASGDIVSFIDGDDVWKQGKLSLVTSSFSQDDRLLLHSHSHHRVSSNLLSLRKFDDTHKNIARIVNAAGSKREDMLRDACILREGFWLGSAFSVRRNALDLQKFELLIQGQPFASSSYFDLVFAPFIISLHPEMSIKYNIEHEFLYRIHGKGSGAAPDLAVRLDSLRRLRCVNRTTKYVLRSLGASNEVIKRYKFLDMELQMQCFAYRKNYLIAFILLVRNFKFLHKKNVLFKELIRIFLLFILGNDGFMRVQNFLNRN